MRIRRFTRIALLLPLAFPHHPQAETLTGTIKRPMRDGRATVVWNAGAEPRVGSVGVVVYEGLATGIFQVAETRAGKSESLIESLDSRYSRPFSKGSPVRILEVAAPPVEAAEAVYLVWSGHLEAPFHVDGKPAGRAPSYILLEPGAHEVVLELPGGGRAGSRLDAGTGEKGVLYLSGRFPPHEPGHLPPFVLEGHRKKREDSEDSGKRDPLRWIDEPGRPRIYRGGGGIKVPKRIHGPDPEFPPQALKQRLRGVVVLEAVVESDGSIVEARAIGATDPIFTIPCVEALRAWRYEPAILDGVPVAMVFEVWVDFSLR